MERPMVVDGDTVKTKEVILSGMSFDGDGALT